MSETPLKIHPIHEMILNTIELPPGIAPFDMENISANIAKRLNIEGFSVEVSNPKWNLPEETRENSQENPSILAISLAPLENELYWIMDQEEISKITSWLLTKDPHTKGFSSEILQEGYYHYLILEALDVMDQDPLFKGLSLKILSSKQTISSTCLTMDVKLTYQDRSCYGRLAFPEEFLKSWKKHISTEVDWSSSDRAKKIDVFLSLRAGHLKITTANWESANVGDFLILDRSYYDPQTHQGTIILSFQNTSLYQGKVKQDKLKILDYAELNEETMEEEKEPIPLKEVPLTIEVEIGKIKMSLEKLMSLKPGEVIETTIKPQEGVSLILNEKKVAKGELVKIGETIGVRILELS